MGLFKSAKTVTLPADPLGDEMWGLAPLRVPWAVDVQGFMDSTPLPLLWPKNARYVNYINDSDSSTSQKLLRSSWINVFLHHPNPDVVLQCLRDAPPDSMLNYPSLTDLLASAHAGAREKQEAAKVAWQISQNAVKFILNILLSRGAVPSNYAAASTQQAVEHLRATCPAERLEWFEAELARR
jgi:hypothetical protein